MAANRRLFSAAGALCLCAAAAAVVALALVGRSGRQRGAALLENRLSGLSVRSREEMEQIIAAADAAWAAGAGANPSLAGSDKVLVAPSDMKDLFDSDLFAYLSERCCKSLYFAPGAEASLPTDWDVNGEKAQAVRAFVGRGNTLVFNDGKGDAIAFINKVPTGNGKLLSLAAGGSWSAMWFGEVHVGSGLEPSWMHAAGTLCVGGVDAGEALGCEYSCTDHDKLTVVFCQRNDGGGMIPLLRRPQSSTLNTRHETLESTPKP